MSTPVDWIQDALAKLGANELRRDLRHIEGAAGPWVELDTPSGRQQLLHLCSNSYLGLADHPEVAEAAALAAHRYGTGAGASRLISGGQAPHRLLEEELAAWKSTPDAVLYSSGYLANLGVITSLVGKGDTIVSDELNHASIVDACRLSGAEVRVYRHVDVVHADLLLRSATGRKLLVSDGVFSMDGDVAPIARLCETAESHGAMVMIDDAHGTGVLGPDGRGSVAAAECSDRVHVMVGTLSKALGAAEGFAACSSSTAEWLRNRSRSFVFDTAPPAPVIEAARRALRISLAEPERRARALRNARDLADGLHEAGVNVARPAACIIPVIVGPNSAALRVMGDLIEAGVLAVAIRPPSVPPGTARLRLTTMATHSEADITLAVEAVAKALAESGALA